LEPSNTGGKELLIKKIANELKVTVVPAKPSHIPAISEIRQASTPKWFQIPYLKKAVREKRAFVSMKGRIPCGVLVWNKDFYGHYFIDLVAVHPAFRRNGLALSLLQKMETICRDKKLYCSTNRSNKRMQKVLMKAKYRKAGSISYLERGDVEWIYYKKIPG
jgi:ribosomal protein S18 acetylase RimI-like enzyme